MDVLGKPVFRIIKKVLALTAVLLHGIMFANNPTDSSHSKQTDLGDLFNRLSGKTGIKHPAHISRYHISAIPVIAYSLQTGVIGGVSGTLSILPKDTGRHNVSNLIGTAAYTARDQRILMLQSILWTKGNIYCFNGDLVYLFYPQKTFGLGTRTAKGDQFILNSSHIRFYETASRNVLPDLLIGGGYNLDYHWNITETKPTERATDFEHYDPATKTVSSGFTLNLTYDSRRNVINPEPGVYANVAWRNNLKALGSTSKWQSLVIDLRKYLRLKKDSKNILAIWNYNCFTVKGKPPYLDLPNTTGDNSASSGRGYIQGRFRGKNMIYLESEYRFEISRNGLFGGVVFTNAQSLSEWPSNQFEAAKLGYGAGVRIKINKHSRTNIALDYGFGAGGSRGLFVNLCEMF